MNKIVKGCITGALIIGAFELGGNFGKGYMLGCMARSQYSANEAIQALEDNKHPTARYVRSVAVYFKDKGR